MDGKFIVIDGTSGSGKATQTELLAERLKKEGYKTKTIEFPQKGKSFFGNLIEQYLNGKFSDIDKDDPYLTSIPFAADRVESKRQIGKWLEEGYVVIADRYTSSNQIHQGSKIEDTKEKNKFLQWLEEMEFKVFNIPRPNSVIYLDVPLKFSVQLLSGEEQEKKPKNKESVHEMDLEKLQKAKDTAEELVNKNKDWIKIDCALGEFLLSVDEIHEKVWEAVKNVL